MMNTYCCFATGSFTELVEVEEEFLDSNSVLGYSCLQTFLTIKLNVKLMCWLSIHGSLLRILTCNFYKNKINKFDHSIQSDRASQFAYSVLSC